MKNLYIILLGILSLASFSAFGQVIEINQSSQIKELMEIKKELGQFEKTFQIQIYNGRITDANAELKKASEKYKLPVTMTFETPNYKIRIGKFRSRIEAEKFLTKIKVDYPAAFVIAPY